jgi:hypothetical protein
LNAERPDIVALWDAFKLIVEYKIDSPEGPDQAARYLKTFGITDPKEGVLIFLSPTGMRPRSVKADDLRVCSLSFDELAKLIDHGLQNGLETTERGRVLAAEYQGCLKRVLKRSTFVGKPIISESTRLLSEHHARFDRLVEAAREEAGDFIDHLALEVERELRPILGPEMVTSVLESWGYFLFRKPTWVAQGLEFGIAFGVEGKLRTRLMHEYDPNISLRVQPRVRDEKVSTQKAFTEALKQAVAPRISVKVDGSNQWFAFYHNMDFPPAGVWEEWSRRVVATSVQVARDLTPAIDAFVASRTSREG